MSETDEVPVAEAALEARLADVSADAAALRVLLPAELQSLISDAVVRSHKLYEEFVDRLVLRVARETGLEADRKSTRLNSSHLVISYAVFCLKKKKKTRQTMNISMVTGKYTA